MTVRLDQLLAEIRELEDRVQEELRLHEERLRYTIRRRRVVFEREIERLHRKLSTPSLRYVLGARLLTVVTAPLIYAMVLPALALDAALWVYQQICLRVYGIPRVRRADHVILDRHYLKYLNFIERLNCDFCSYFNGLVSYAGEIAARTEQYWCPIKHASGKAARHSRYHLFADFGDAEGYRARLEGLRKQFDDLR